MLAVPMNDTFNAKTGTCDVDHYDDACDTRPKHDA